MRSRPTITITGIVLAYVINYLNLPLYLTPTYTYITLYPTYMSLSYACVVAEDPEGVSSAVPT